jgi:hypothetical protein
MQRKLSMCSYHVNRIQVRAESSGQEINCGKGNKVWQRSDIWEQLEQIKIECMRK